MKNITTHAGTLTNLTRLPSSINGNPRYEFEVDGCSIRLAVDSSFGYEITNYNEKRVIVTAGTHYGRLTLNTIHKA